ncbi:hypothetical protein JY96_17140 [Aquabacterium sp. NJ1]|nr:hypothetical protein JY96_17140 [Aquabacterium sp. NJ1]
MVLLVNDNTTVPDTFEDTSEEPVVLPLLPPLEPLPNAALFDTLYAGELELPPPPHAATSAVVAAHSTRFFQFITFTRHFRFGYASQASWQTRRFDPLRCQAQSGHLLSRLKVMLEPRCWARSVD